MITTIALAAGIGALTLTLGALCAALDWRDRRRAARLRPETFKTRLGAELRVIARELHELDWQSRRTDGTTQRSNG